MRRKIMRVGKLNKKCEYTMNNYDVNPPVLVEKNQLERDLGILITSNLKFLAQSNKSASNANKKLGILKRT